ncbi:NRDE family protein [Candidatus Spongiihabitans sp.]|uniref:NRDE family protein n=1 Tax=Candidatus Spongiihabitans sp. TaxID=3101308 RepID=UPI003C7E036A
MCILFLAINQHPDYPLIVAANRDESFARSSQSMHYWPDHPEILAGRDALQGGSWLGVNSAGRFCAVTNFSTGAATNRRAKSRGWLVQRYLAHEETDKRFIASLQKTHREYNPFNLVFGTPENISLFCSENSSLHCLTEGFHSLSNGFVDQRWPKMSYGVQRLTELISGNAMIEISQLNALMRDQSKAGEHDLPGASAGIDPGINPGMNMSQAMEKQRSSIFIRASDHGGHGDHVDYGTRTTSYVLYSHENISVYEFNYDKDARVTDQQAFTLPRG